MPDAASPTPQAPRPQPTALLRHTTDEGAHHDWLIGDPTNADPEGRLWTARVQPDSSRWRELGQFTLTPLPPHRRLYLQYEGPLTAGRGHVQRVDQGHIFPERWQPDFLRLDVHMRHFTGRVELRRQTTDRWLATLLEYASSPPG